MRSTCTSRRSSSAPASASMTTRLTTGSSGFTGSATAIPLRRSTCGTDPSLPVGPQPALRARPRPSTARGSRAEAGRGGCADPPERVLPEQRRCRARPGWRVAHRPRGARLRNGRPRERPSRVGPDRCGRVLYASALGSPALARPARRGAPLRHGPLRGHCPRSAVGRALEGPHRRVDTAGHRRAGTAGPARPHYRPARRDGADSLGWPSSPDYRASSACPGPCGAADRGTRGSRRRRHAF